MNWFCSFCSTHLNILCWLITEYGCGTFKGGERDSKVGQSKNIFNNYSWDPAYLYHTSTLWKICIALQWGETKWREKEIWREGNRGGWNFGIKRANTKSGASTLFSSFGSACDETWVQWAIRNVQCASCTWQRFPFMFNAKFCQLLLCHHQKTSSQTLTVYPPFQLTPKTGWIKHLPHRPQLSRAN